MSRETSPKSPAVAYRAALLLGGLLLTLGGGLAYGRLSQRWGPPADLRAAAQRIEELPRQIGDWQAAGDLPLGEDVARMLQCEGHVNRRYVNRRTGDSIGLALIVGPPGPTAVHTPEICYSSRAFQQEQERLPERIADGSGREHAFWRVRFRAKEVGGLPMAAWYAWSNGGPWEASRNPRYAYGGGRLLHKIQLSANLPRGRLEAADDPCRDFLQQLVASDWRLLEP
jgi:hypothetical protein